jgi:hypothetical protein
MLPIIAAPESSRPSAAVIVGEVLCAFRAVSTSSFEVMAKARIALSAAVALTI